MDVERCISALRNDVASNRWSQDEIESILSQSNTHQAAVLPEARTGNRRRRRRKPTKGRSSPGSKDCAHLRISITNEDSGHENGARNESIVNVHTIFLYDIDGKSNSKFTTRFFAANPRHKNIVDFAVDAAVLASVDHVLCQEIPNALNCVSETLDNACKLAATVSAAEQKRLHAMNTGEQRQWKMTKPTLEDAWSSAFETAIERATMLALREIGSVIAKKAADDAAKRAGAAAAALLREPSSEEDGVKDDKIEEEEEEENTLVTGSLRSRSGRQRCCETIRHGTFQVSGAV